MTTNDLRVYFSFRSPFSWFAFHRITSSGVFDWNDLDAIPIFPYGGAQPTAGRAKSSYIREDVERFATAYGLELNWPQGEDPDWFPSHAVYLWARQQGRAVDYAREAYRTRFSKGRDLGDVAVIQAAAESAGLDGDEAARVAEDADWKERVLAGFAHTRQDGAFGVPMFIYRGERFWGNDRLDWLLREMSRSRGRQASDLGKDPFAPVHSR